MTVKIFVGDCLQVLDLLPADSIGSCVTDPPYHLVSIVKRFAKSPARNEKTVGREAYGRHARGFMGKTWDGGDIAFRPELWAEVLRALKPGAHLIAFGGTRTYHRMACAIEDAGFEIRDQIGWLYGSGFPKSHDIGDGWGTALKPAWEPIVLARKPLIGTVAKNVQEYGTGAINIDGCRVDAEKDRPWRQPAGMGVALSGSVDGSLRNEIEDRSHLGRWPANVIHDGSEEVIAAFPDAKGQQGDLAGHASARQSPNGIFGAMAPAKDHTARIETDKSAARFFYCAKASKKDRDEGLDSFQLQSCGMMEDDNYPIKTGSGNLRDTKRRNNHPTVKPTDLMRYLCRLVTPPGGTVLDPFMGSGSTGKAAMREGFGFVGIEREAEYFEIASRRITAEIFA